VIDKIEKLMFHRDIVKFVQKSSMLKVGNDQRGMARLISFNISNDIDMFKYYYELDEIPSDEMILNFLPYKEEFLEYTKFWNPKEYSSLAFGKKVTNNNSLDYFHVKFDPERKIYLKFKEFECPKLISRNYNINTQTGVSFEYEKNKKIKKNYFYFYTPVDKIYINKHFKLNIENLNLIDHFEYTEFEDLNKNKVIAVYNNTGFKNCYDVLRDMNNDRVNIVLDYFIEKYSLYPVLFGQYKKDNTVAIYWSLTHKERDFIWR